MLQAWINWNELRDISPSTIKVAFSNLRKYLFYRKIRTNEQDVREYLRFPKTPKEEKHPLSDHEYRVIVDAFAKNPLHQSICLALDSCAMLCKKETGHGSQQSVRNYISMLTSTVGDFEVVKDKKKIIRLKDSNPFKK